MTWLAGNTAGPSGPSASTSWARPSAWRIRRTGCSSRTSDPCSVTSSWHRSHIIPGPYRGYSNSSMRLVMSFWLRRGINEFRIALKRDRFLIRWAAQSAWSSSAGIPQTFSV